jgi:hypothetical protein
MSVKESLNLVTLLGKLSSLLSVPDLLKDKKGISVKDGVCIFSEEGSMLFIKEVCAPLLAETVEYSYDTFDFSSIPSELSQIIVLLKLSKTFVFRLLCKIPGVLIFKISEEIELFNLFFTHLVMRTCSDYHLSLVMKNAQVNKKVSDEIIIDEETSKEISFDDSEEELSVSEDEEGKTSLPVVSSEAKTNFQIRFAKTILASLHKVDLKKFFTEEECKEIYSKAIEYGFAPEPTVEQYLGSEELISNDPKLKGFKILAKHVEKVKKFTKKKNVDFKSPGNVSDVSYMNHFFRTVPLKCKKFRVQSGGFSTPWRQVLSKYYSGDYDKYFVYSFANRRSLPVSTYKHKINKFEIQEIPFPKKSNTKNRKRGPPKRIVKGRIPKGNMEASLTRYLRSRKYIASYDVVSFDGFMAQNQVFQQLSVMKEDAPRFRKEFYNFYRKKYDVWFHGLNNPDHIVGFVNSAVRRMTDSSCIEKKMCVALMGIAHNNAIRVELDGKVSYRG